MASDLRWKKKGGVSRAQTDHAQFKIGEGDSNVSLSVMCTGEGKWEHFDCTDVADARELANRFAKAADEDAASMASDLEQRRDAAARWAGMSDLTKTLIRMYRVYRTATEAERCELRLARPDIAGSFDKLLKEEKEGKAS